MFGFGAIDLANDIKNGADCPKRLSQRLVRHDNLLPIHPLSNPTIMALATRDFQVGEELFLEHVGDDFNIAG
jgi:hypothetical protein